MKNEIKIREGFKYCILDDGTAEIVDYTKGVTELEIPSEIDGHKVTSISFEAFYDCNSLKSVTIPDSVTSIGGGAFYDCVNLECITIGSGVTSVGENAFYNTAWYNNQPDGVVYIGQFAYSYKGAMPKNTSIEIEEGTTLIVDAAFEHYVNLVSITIPDSVTSIGDCAFYRCYNLINIAIPDSVTNIGNYAFYNCFSLASITIPNSVIKIGEGAFDSCYGLKNVIIPDSVTRIGRYVLRRNKE